LKRFAVCLVLGQSQRCVWRIIFFSATVLARKLWLTRWTMHYSALGTASYATLLVKVPFARYAPQARVINIYYAWLKCLPTS